MHFITLLFGEIVLGHFVVVDVNVQRVGACTWRIVVVVRDTWQQCAVFLRIVVRPAGREVENDAFSMFLERVERLKIVESFFKDVATNMLLWNGVIALTDGGRGAVAVGERERH